MYLNTDKGRVYCRLFDGISRKCSSRFECNGILISRNYEKDYG